MKQARHPEEIETIRTQILDTTLQLMAEQGFHAITVRKLANRVGMTAPNLYNYFANKNELYVALMLSGFERLLAHLEKALAGTTDPEERVYFAMKAYLAFALGHPHHYQLMFSSDTPKYKEFEGSDLEHLSLQQHEQSMELAGLGERLLRDLSSSTGSAHGSDAVRDMLATVWSLLHGMATLTLSQNLNYLVEDLDRILQNAATLLLRQWLIRGTKSHPEKQG
jgi:AcrR family transcriptional regulator